MTIKTGESLPEGTLLKLGESGPAAVKVSELTKGRKVVLFGLPGAYTGVCTTAHVPSFIRSKAGFDAKGVDEIVCVSVNDPFVMDAWSKATGAGEAGLSFLGDASGEFVKALGLDFSAPPAGLFGRSKRFAMLVEDGVVKVLHVEESPGVCVVSAGESLLEDI